VSLQLVPVSAPTTAITSANGVTEIFITGTMQPNQKLVFEVTGDTVIFCSAAPTFAVDECRVSFDDGPEVSIVDESTCIKTIPFRRMMIRNNSIFAITPFVPVHAIVGAGEELLYLQESQ
jgi:hypothetical protein